MVIEARYAHRGNIELACKIAVEAWKPIYDNYSKLLGDELFEILHRDWQDVRQRRFRITTEDIQNGCLSPRRMGRLWASLLSSWIEREGSVRSLTMW